MKLIKNTRIITPVIEIKKGFLVIKDKVIHFVGDYEKDCKEYKYFESRVKRIIDLRDKICVPGFIDIHTHGALGKDYTSSPGLLIEDSKFKIKQGVTGFLPTLGAMVEPKKILDSASGIIKLMEEQTLGARVLGINFEGPFINPKIGAQNPNFCLSKVDFNFLMKAISIMGNKFKIITIAPEIEDSIKAISFLREKGVIPSIGHTIANEQLLDRAIRNGAKLVTHLLNTTYQPQQNIKGVVISGVNEYLMIRDDVMAEIICDVKGVHINPTMLKVCIKCKGVNRIIIITDSYMTPGVKRNKKFYMPDGTEFYVKNGVNIQTKSGHLTGSAMTLDLSINSMMKHSDSSLKDVILMATFNPAKIIGVQDKKGSIEVGKDADIVVIDEDINIYMTIIEGNIVYDNLKKEGKKNVRN